MFLCYAQEYKIDKDKAPENFLDLAEDTSLLEPECEVDCEFEVTDMDIGSVSFHIETGILRREVNLTVETDNEDLEEQDVVGVYLDNETLYMIDGKMSSWQEGCDMKTGVDTNEWCEFYSEEY